MCRPMDTRSMKFQALAKYCLAEPVFHMMETSSMNSPHAVARTRRQNMLSAMILP